MPLPESVIFSDPRQTNALLQNIDKLAPQGNTILAQLMQKLVGSFTKGEKDPQRVTFYAVFAQAFRRFKADMKGTDARGSLYATDYLRRAHDYLRDKRELLEHRDERLLDWGGRDLLAVIFDDDSLSLKVAYGRVNAQFKQFIWDKLGELYEKATMCTLFERFPTITDIVRALLGDISDLSQVSKPQKMIAHLLKKCLTDAELLLVVRRFFSQSKTEFQAMFGGLMEIVACVQMTMRRTHQSHPLPESVQKRLKVMDKIAQLYHKFTSEEEVVAGDATLNEEEKKQRVKDSYLDELKRMADGEDDEETRTLMEQMFALGCQDDNQFSSDDTPEQVQAKVEQTLQSLQKATGLSAEELQAHLPAADSGEALPPLEEEEEE